MKLLELRLTAYGPFQDKSIDLSGGDPGLHVIYGRNETGKSSALRALHALLFGIPMQTPDAFVHPYDRLRLGGRLRLAIGAEIDFTRIKRQKGTLRAADGTPLPDNALDRFVAGVSANQFTRFWGIDHERLVEGGREILERRGDVGESLFAAGLGASRLGALRRQLDAEAAALFAPHAQKPEINLALAKLRELRGALHAATVSAEQCAKRESDLTELVKDIEGKAARVRDLASERARLERLKRVLPALQERAAVTERLAPVASVVLLSVDFATRRKLAEAARRTARETKARCEGEIEKAEGLIRDLGPSSPLVVETSQVTELHQRLGSHRKALRDRPGLAAQRAELHQQAKRLLAEFRPGAEIEIAESLRPFYGRRRRIQRLAEERAKIEGRLEAALTGLEEARAEEMVIEREAKALPPVHETEKLVAVLEDARSQGDVEASRDKSSQALKRLESEVNAGLKRLGLAADVVDRLGEIGLPARGTVSRFEKRAQDIDEEMREDKSGLERIARDLREVDAKIASLRRKSSVPTEEELAALRQKRDKAFNLLRAQWEDQRDVSTEARELLGRGKLVELYPKSVEVADAAADRMRQEADRVAEFASFSKDKEDCIAERQVIEARTKVRDKARGDLDVEWRHAWRRVCDDPPTIADAESWRERFDHLVERAAELGESRSEIEKLDRWIDTRTRRLHTAVQALEAHKALPETLAASAAVAQKLLKRIEGEERMRQTHARKCEINAVAIKDAKTRERKARDEISAWRTQWTEAVGDAAGPGEHHPDDVLGALDRVEKILKWLDEAATLDVRIAGIDRDAKDFRDDVHALAERLGEAGSLVPNAEDTWLESLHARVAEENRVEERRTLAVASREGLIEESTKADDAIAAGSSQIELLVSEARSASEADLPLAEERSAQRRSLEEILATVEKELIRNGGGKSIGELAAEAVATTEDAIAARLLEIESESSAFEEDLSGLREQRATIQAELQGIRGQSPASDRREDVQAVIAQVRDSVVRYARLRIASTLLARRIEEYRRKNQAPLLTRASEMFRAMTLGSFDSLDVAGDGDEPVLVGVRPDGHHVETAGMSDGSVDQLFLALRLAAVEAACASGEPMPFVVDDVLVKFDDMRAAAALGVLAEVASKTQVVLFTHHERVRECAEMLGGPAGVMVQTL